MDEFVSPSLEQTRKALDFIVPLITNMDVPWIITGGFACYVYGVERSLSDIDIDFNCAHNDPKFVKFLQQLEDFITQPLIHLQDDDYDNYNFEATIDGVTFDCCPGDDLKLFDPETGQHESAYRFGFPAPVIVPFYGFQLPLLSKERIIAQKEQLQRPVDLTDIAALKKLI